MLVLLLRLPSAGLRLISVPADILLLFQYPLHQQSLRTRTIHEATVPAVRKVSSLFLFFTLQIKIEQFLIKIQK